MKSKTKKGIAIGAGVGAVTVGTVGVLDYSGKLAAAGSLAARPLTHLSAKQTEAQRMKGIKKPDRPGGARINKLSTDAEIEAEMQRVMAGEWGGKKYGGVQRTILRHTAGLARTRDVYAWQIASLKKQKQRILEADEAAGVAGNPASVKFHAYVDREIVKAERNLARVNQQINNLISFRDWAASAAKTFADLRTVR
jgi:hypothetical protein